MASLHAQDTEKLTIWVELVLHVNAKCNTNSHDSLLDLKLQKEQAPTYLWLGQNIPQNPLVDGQDQSHR